MLNIYSDVVNTSGGFPPTLGVSSEYGIKSMQMIKKNLLELIENK